VDLTAALLVIKVDCLCQGRMKAPEPSLVRAVCIQSAGPPSAKRSRAAEAAPIGSVAMIPSLRLEYSHPATASVHSAGSQEYDAGACGRLGIGAITMRTEPSSASAWAYFGRMM